MTQEKQTSIRILQSKPVKKTLGKSTIFLLGLLTGVIFTSIFFSIFTSLNSANQLDTSSDETQTETLQQAHEEEKSASEHDESAVAYKQHMNDKDFNQIFKHDNKQINQKPTGSPFEQIIKPEDKSAPVTTPKSQVPLAKPTVNQAKQKVEPTPKKVTNEKPEIVQEEISPEGSVKMSIDRKVVEDKP